MKKISLKLLAVVAATIGLSAFAAEVYYLLIKKYIIETSEQIKGESS